LSNKRHLKPIYNRSKMLLNSQNGIREVEFIYPTALKWACKRCGACCNDPKNRERRILLLKSDLERFLLNELFPNDGTKPVEGQVPFVAEMKKTNGSCVLLTENGCKLYGSRALLCRMYPFWVERQDALLIVRHDDDCPGIGSGEPVTENVFRKLLAVAIDALES
jgi:Fe-S-cluster containining protein